MEIFQALPYIWAVGFGKFPSSPPIYKLRNLENCQAPPFMCGVQRSLFYREVRVVIIYALELGQIQSSSLYIGFKIEKKFRGPSLWRARGRRTEWTNHYICSGTEGNSELLLDREALGKNKKYTWMKHFHFSYVKSWIHFRISKDVAICLLTRKLQGVYR